MLVWGDASRRFVLNFKHSQNIPRRSVCFVKKKTFLYSKLFNQPALYYRRPIISLEIQRVSAEKKINIQTDLKDK